MDTTLNYRCAPPPDAYKHDEHELPDRCPVIRADDRPNPADDAKKADGSHDIGTEDGLHEIGLADYFADESRRQRG